MIDIIVLTYNQEDFTNKCLESILNHTNDYRMVWADNGSKASSRQMVMPYFLNHQNRLSIWSQKNLGFIKGINNSIRSLIDIDETDAEYIVLQNNDTIVTKGWLDKMKKVLDENPKIAAVGPVSSVQGSVHCWKRLLKSINFNYDPRFGQWDTDKRAEYLSQNLEGRFCEALTNLKPPLVKMVAFFASVIRVSVIKEIGILDELFGLGLCDDRDYCKRIYDAGYECAIALDSYVHHDHHVTFKAEIPTFKIGVMHEENIKLFKTKHGL